MILWSASSIGKRVSLLGVLAVSVWLLAGTPANGQSATAPAASTALTKTTIQAAQKRLLALGYQPGTADGVMGAKAIAAVKKFQADRSLLVTGQLDRKTLGALDAAPPAPTAGRPATQPQPGTTVPSAGQEKITSPVQKGAPPTDTSITLPLTQHYAGKDYHYTCHPTLESQKHFKLMEFGGEMELPGEQKEMPSDSLTITLQDPHSTWYCTQNHDR